MQSTNEEKEKKVDGKEGKGGEKTRINLTVMLNHGTSSRVGIARVVINKQNRCRYRCPSWAFLLVDYVHVIGRW